MNLRSAGTVRDARKWPKRDKRKDPNRLDLINFKLLSPYTIQKMLNGVQILTSLQQAAGEHTEYFTYHNVKIRNSSLKRGIRFYEIGTTKFLGNCLTKRLENREIHDIQQLREALKPDTEIGKDKWLDLVGLLVPEEVVDRMLGDVEDGRINTLEQLAGAFASMHEGYASYEWTWAANVLEKQLGKSIGDITGADVEHVVSRWKDAVVELDNLLHADATKEFAPTVQIGYGIDGDQHTMSDDFAQVRGTLEANSFVSEIKEHIDRKTKLGDEVIARIRQLPAT